MKEELSVSDEVLKDREKLVQIILPMIRENNKGEYDEPYDVEKSFDFTTSDGGVVHILCQIAYAPEHGSLDMYLEQFIMRYAGNYEPSNNTMTIPCFVHGQKIYIDDVRDVVAHELTHRLKQSRYNKKPVNQKRSRKDKLYHISSQVASNQSLFGTVWHNLGYALYACYDEEIDANTQGLFSSIRHLGYINNPDDFVLKDDRYGVSGILKAIRNSLAIIDELDDGLVMKMFSATKKRIRMVLEMGMRKYLRRIGSICTYHNKYLIRETTYGPLPPWGKKSLGIYIV